ncbi:MAG: AEC family transporter [Bacillota bacterium]|jgi:predicted permease
MLLIKLYNNLLALVLMMLTGAGLAKTGYIDAKMRAGLNKLVFSFTLPLLVFNSMYGSITRELLGTSLYPLVFGAGLSILNGGVAWLLGMLFHTAPQERPLVSFMNMFGNNIYLALPMVTALFGAETASTVLLYTIGSDLVFWTLGVAMLSGQKSLSVRDLRHLLNPTFVGLILGSLAGLAQLQLPVFLSYPISQLGGLTTPLSLMLTGASLADIRLKEGTGSRETGALLLGKLIISPAIAAVAASLLGLNDSLRQVLVIMASMPTVVRSIVLSDRYGWDSRKTALGVLATTIACFITIPIVLTLVQR